MQQADEAIRGRDICHGLLWIYRLQVAHHFREFELLVLSFLGSRRRR